MVQHFMQLYRVAYGDAEESPGPCEAKDQHESKDDHEDVAAGVCIQAVPGKSLVADEVAAVI